MEHIQERVLEEYTKGNIVFADIEGLHSANLEDFISQHADGILYDLNRTESVVLNFIQDPKWINDYAVAKVIRALKNRIDELEKQTNG